jgi:FtsH-binding integral membrane protein
VVGGAGFGAFIDELGKFITSDNDYFYRPTAALIYIIFIGLFLVFRWIDRRRSYSQVELLINSADMLKEVIIEGARSDEIHQALTLLERSGDTSELAQTLHRAIHLAERVPDAEPSLPASLARRGRRMYEQLLGHTWFRRTVLSVFTVNAAAGIIVVLFVSLTDATLGSVLHSGDRSITTLALGAAAILVWVLTLVGTVRLRRSRIAGYQWFKRSVLIMIFFVQVFLFMQNHLAALGGLTANLLLLLGINGMIRAERERMASQLQPSSGEARRTP